MSRVEKTPGICGGRARIAGRRIPVWAIVHYLRRGLSARKLQAYFMLSPEEIQSATRYAEANADEIERDIQENSE